ncbi:MAG: hypothetical protein EXS51_03250 [Candidatus Taylorbacteria bacterium]|nr:hypothetical protein [Candidatus Taylorbacteria bacterium]
MKIFLWGLLVFVLGILGWVVSVVLAVVTGGQFKEVANLFGRLAFGSLFVTILVAVVAWLLKSRKKHDTHTQG